MHYRRVGRVYKIDLLRCIFCGYCVEACPVEAIEMTDGYELANYKREDFNFDKERLLK
jgi:NADH-quinone oxidoreductase subunit I